MLVKVNLDHDWKCFALYLKMFLPKYTAMTADERFVLGDAR